MGRAIDLAGQRFGRLSVRQRASSINGLTAWSCACDCGNVRVVRTGDLRSGKTRGCGCTQAAATRRANATHHASGSLTYVSWQAMRQRCTNPKRADFRLYGGNGVSVCARWAVFENFLADMGERPSAAHSIDRFPAKSGNYEPGNCRWALMKDQARNTGHNRIIQFRGRPTVLAEACQTAGVPYNRAHDRLRLGWSVERALSP